MSATLVQTFSFHQPHRIRVKDCIPSRNQHNLSLSLVSPTVNNSYRGAVDEKCAIQLMHLASQYHGSEYNRMKFGPQGCPILYIPMSFNMPDHVKELQARQIECTEQRAWWPCERQENTNDGCEPFPPIRQPVVLGPCGSSMTDTLHLQEEISDAIAAPLESTPRFPTTVPTHLQLKTSDSHPLNISMIIPAELLPIISSHLVPLPKSSPVLFDLPPTYSLDRITSRGQPFSPLRKFSSDWHHMAIARSLRPPLAHLRTRPSVTQAIQAAISSGLAAVARDLSTPMLTASRNDMSSDSCAVRSTPWSSAHVTDTRNTSRNDNKTFTAPSGVEMYDEADLTPSATHKLSVTSHSNPSPAQDIPETTMALPTSNRNISLLDSPSLSHRDTSFTPPVVSSFEKYKDAPTSPSYSPITPKQAPSSGSLGNIFLSSCPGKKVRLSGPIQGRCGVFRDLDTDLRRIRGLGVVCIICCLDDNELEFLGVPWPEYSRVSREIGMDILRIPTPEGLTPPSLPSFDSHLSHIINRYTLRGASILVHCRGGVGRAGLVACCWMLKLGLCGWIETDLRQGSRNDEVNDRSGWETGVCAENSVRRDTMQLVERVIGVVRRRRSVKAVETYEQVKFLVDFVEYLRDPESL